MPLYNHYSAPIIGVLLLVIGTVLVWRRGKKLRDWILLDSVLTALVVAWLVFRPVANPAARSAGLPVLLEVQSPYCLGCVALKPAVDRLENELRDRLVVRRVNIQSTAGRQLATQYGIEFTPTFVLLDAAGQEQWRSVGRLDADHVRATVAAPAGEAGTRRSE